ncbi:Ribonuclease R [Pseudomonas savastanoi pv. glycinea]|nr:Ribonuclease R [Pseudomonas savastanoi pv. glycinea]
MVPHLKQLYAMYKVLLGARHVRGAIDFETQETRIIFGSERKIAEIRPTTRNDAHKLIEECMLAANVATAQFLKKHEIPALYRVHDGPPPERLEKLRAFLGELGLTLHKGKEGPTPKDYQALLETVRDRPDYHLIQTVMLRSLSQAVYSSDNNGHFGLNYEAYTHFTSPIRRYPDLLTHRAIRSVIRSKQDTPHVRRAGAATIPKARIYPYDDALLDQLGEQCSMSERRADEATRDVVNWLKCEYMKDRVGESFPGVITAVTGFGLFVELTDIYVEGLVHVTALPGDYYHFDPLHHRLAGERTGRNFRLGDSVEVRVMRVDLDERKIDFEISETAAAATPAGRKRRGHDTAPPAATTTTEKEKAPAKSGRHSASAKESSTEAYRPSDAAAKNAEVRKSRELKKALLADAKGGSKASSVKSDRSGSAPSSSKSASKHRKGPSKSGSAPTAKSGGARKPKAKS